MISMDRIFGRLPLMFILAAWLAVLVTGLIAPGPMVGDEVTHFYMLKTQAGKLPAPSFESEISVGPADAEKEVRCYPHAFFWHYLGAVVYKVTGSLAAVQVYQSLFLLQLLVVVYAITRRLSAAGSGLGGLLVVASQPVTLLFSVVFYQDVPATAQVLTAFFFLLRGQWLPAALFLALGVGIKENMILFVPAFMLWLCAERWSTGIQKLILPVIVTLVILFSGSWLVMWSLHRYALADYYPAQVLKVTVNKFLNLFPSQPVKQQSAGDGRAAENPPPSPRPVSLFPPEVLANHPGNLNNPVNWVLYGGGVMWLMVLLGIAGIFAARMSSAKEGIDRRVLYFGLTGVSSLLFSFLFMNIPDARFFYPGLVFCLVALAVPVERLPGCRFLMTCIAVLGLIQGGLVLHKAYSLRGVSKGIMEAVDYLSRNAPAHNRIFMYPEGNYRLFPCKHEWYLLPEYEIRELWKGSNDRRLELLHKHKIGAIVVKKHLVGTLDKDMENLGIYPDFFVKQIDSDVRFEKVVDNRDIAIYSLPQ